MGRAGRLLKRTTDLSAALTGLALSAPVLIATAALVRVRLGRNVLFRQRRIGLLGREFTIFKFRTMSEERDASGRLLSDKARLTGVGAWIRGMSLDELPQLWNVVKGEMSLVGPRPLLPQYLPRYNARQRRRHEVKPGITGWAQVNGRNALNWEEKFEMDVWYVDHQSCWLDLRILWRTLVKVLRREGIRQTGHATMSEFMGSTGGRAS